MILRDLTAAKPCRSLIKAIRPGRDNRLAITIQSADLAGTIAGAVGHNEVVSYFQTTDKYTIERRGA